jgi:mannosyl-3-phosphoglycerate phosphatase
VSAKPGLVVFSDVESLIESPARLPEAAAAVRQTVATRAIPLVLCSTRTRAELEHVQCQFDIAAPFICENGAAVYVPDEYFEFPLADARRSSGYHVIEFGRPYADVVAALGGVAKRLGIDVVGFHQLSVEEVARECNWPLQQARLAKLREYGEPFRIVSRQPDQRIRLFRALGAEGFGCAAGGRYDYVGAPIDEVTGMSMLTRWFRRSLGSVVTIGLGDPVRDAGLLEYVQVPLASWRADVDPPEHLIMKRPGKGPEQTAQGPDVWRLALRRLSQRFLRQADAPTQARLNYHSAHH